MRNRQKEATEPCIMMKSLWNKAYTDATNNDKCSLDSVAALQPSRSNKQPSIETSSVQLLLVHA